MKNTFKIFFLILLITIVGCTDESKDPLPQLEKGAFIRFANSQPSATFEDPQLIEFSDQIYDPNNNVIEYKLALRAVISGTTLIAENFITETSFPTTISFNSQSLADALGIDVSEIRFGDVFEFTATATRNDGVVFYGEAPSLDPDNLTVGLGNTENNLLAIAGYTNAMKFGTIIACTFVQADMVGTYTIINDSGYSISGATTFEVIAGPLPSQIILVNPFGSSQNYEVLVDVNDFGIATIDPKQNVFLTEEYCCAGYSPTSIATNPALTSLALSCIGYIELNVNNFIGIPPETTGFTFGGLTQLSAQKN